MKNQDVFIFTSQNYGRKKTDGIRILQWNVHIFLFFQASFNYHNLAAQAHHGSSNNNGLFNECSMTAAAAANYYYNTASNWNTPASDYKIIWTFTTSTHSAAFCFKVCPILFLEVHTSYFLSDQLNISPMKPEILRHIYPLFLLSSQGLPWIVDSCLQKKLWKSSKLIFYFFLKTLLLRISQ